MGHDAKSLSNMRWWSALSVLTGAIPLAYLVLYPDFVAALWPTHALGVAAFVALGAGFMALGVGRVRSVWAWIKGVPRPLVWLMALIFALPMLHAANVLQVRFNALTLIPLYAVVLGGVLGLVAWREWGERGVLPLDAGRDSRGALRLALIFALVSLAANLVIAWAFGAGLAPDSYDYVRHGAYLFDTSVPLAFRWRTFPYSVIPFLGQANDNAFGTLFLHGLLSAVAVGAIVYVLGRRNRVLSAAVGLFLASDPVWLGANRYVMTEGPTVSYLLLALALLIHHQSRGRHLKKGGLLLAGAFYAWALYVRAANLPLMLVIVLFYIVVVHKPAKLLYLVSGMFMMLAVFIVFNGWRYQLPTLTSNSAVNYDGTLFVSGLYDPHAGNVSRLWDGRVRMCFPQIDTQYGGDFLAYIDARSSYYDLFRIRTNLCVYENGFTGAANTYAAMLSETVRANPIGYVAKQLEQNSASFAIVHDPLLLTEVQLYGFTAKTVKAASNIVPRCTWCDTLTVTPPVDLRDSFWQTLMPTLAAIRQPYLFTGVTPHIPSYLGGLENQQDVQIWGFGTGYQVFGLPDRAAYCNGRGEHPCVSLSILVAWLLWVGFVWILSRGAMRWLVSLTFVFLHWVILSTTLGYYLEPRYATMIAPLMLLIAVIGWVTVGAGVWQLLTRK